MASKPFVGADVSEPVWITGWEARRILDWVNTDSVRNAARRGAFRWRKRGNGRLEYLQSDVWEYRNRKREPAEEEAGAEA